jgi:hypothetical protein
MLELAEQCEGAPLDVAELAWHVHVGAGCAGRRLQMARIRLLCQGSSRNDP